MSIASYVFMYVAMHYRITRQLHIKNKGLGYHSASKQ